MTPRHFFFYGTLRQDLAQGEIARLVADMALIGPATVRGRLFARRDPRGAYPVLLPGLTSVAHGRLYRARRLTRTQLAALDRYEGVGSGGEYTRRALAAQLPDGARVRAQAYVLKGSLPPDLTPIGEGDFASFLAHGGKRLRVFRP